MDILLEEFKNIEPEEIFPKPKRKTRKLRSCKSINVPNERELSQEFFSEQVTQLCKERSLLNTSFFLNSMSFTKESLPSETEEEKKEAKPQKSRFEGKTVTADTELNVQDFSEEIVKNASGFYNYPDPFDPLTIEVDVHNAEELRSKWSCPKPPRTNRRNNLPKMYSFFDKNCKPIFPVYKECPELEKTDDEEEEEEEEILPNYSESNFDN